MPSEINCPNCGHQFNAERQLEEDLEKKYKEAFQQKLNENLRDVEQSRKALENQRLDFEQKKKKENELFMEKLNSERQKLQTELSEQLRKSIAGDYENQLKMLQTQQADTEEKLKLSREKELAAMKLQSELQKRADELDIEVQKKLQAERAAMQDTIRKQELEKSQLEKNDWELKVKSLETQLDQQKKLAEEMRRKAEQGSMQLQGEAHEVLLEEALRQHFPFDVIEPVRKGAEGADCVQIVRNQLGQKCGRIIYESKNTKHFSKDWIDKLKADMRQNGADISILVSKVFPKDMERFGERDGVWICSFQEVLSVASLIRNGILQLFEAQRSQENKGDKMQMLYSYLTGNEFRGQVEAIMEGFTNLRNNITRERVQMEKMWKEREKQLEKVLLSTSGMYGSIKGIAGDGIGSIPLLDGNDDYLIDD